jgi:glycosyltransferase involved in cell wall biosynthesis
MKKPLKISVITVVYNAVDHIVQTIESVAEQTYKEVEYIVIDGGSDDGTVDRLKSHGETIDFWLSEPDKGIYDAMNKGIDRVTGEWVLFLNAGDKFCDSTTLAHTSLYLNDEADLVAGDIYYCDGDAREYRSPKGLDYRYDGMFCYHQALFARASLFDTLRFNAHYKVAGDYDFVLRCLEAGHRFTFIPLAIADFMAGGMAESNPVLGRLEDMMIALPYLSQEEDIFNTNTYARFESCKPGNNRVFARLLNMAKLQLDTWQLQGKRIVIYGFGTLGKILRQRYSDEVVAIADKNFSDFGDSNGVEIIAPEGLAAIDYDCLIISVLGREKEIVADLVNRIGIDEKKVLTFEL